ncbi:MAG: hypothetical protein L0Z62_33095, partial [Gemmataceae bacterium]|nr:hypothetical protein [Gemmataceae bacterium]
MKLLPGERLPGSGPPHQPGGYLVTEVIGETPWSGLYGARKILYNFDFTAKRPRETDDKEWLDVLLRTVNYPRLDSAEYVTGRRALARAEGTVILANRGSNLWPEPLDLLELTNTRDPFTFARGIATGAACAQVAQAAQTRTVLGSSDPLAREPVVVLARPHGEPLARWLHTDPPTATLLSVIAELLEFVHSAHDDGLLLNSLSPSTLLVDRAGRMHYLGTDSVVPLTPAADLPDWRPFFPPERYPRGYSAPECFDPAAPRDRLTDLYAWAAIAYHVLTRDRPVQSALEQGQPWTRFGDSQFTRLQQALTAIPHGHVRNWAEQLGVNADALLAGWPHNLVMVLLLCLSPEPERRPPTVADLRVWMIAPPPPPPLAALALRLPRSDTVRLFCHAPEAGPDLDVIVRRGSGTYPATPQEGQPVAEMAPSGWVEDTCPRVPCPTGSADDPLNPAGDAARYTFFARRRHPPPTPPGSGGVGGGSCSAATLAYLLEPYPTNIRRLAEVGAKSDSPDEPEPPRVALLFHALDTARTADALLPSPLPQVRGWALRRVTAARRLPGASPALETLLLRALQDPVQGLRLEAVTGLLAGPTPPPEPLVRRVFEILAAIHPEDCSPAARVLRKAGVREERLRLALAAVKQDLPANCPACGIELPDRDLAAHLTSAHGYLEMAGELLPRGEALARLWERVFRAGDTTAHDRLSELLLGAGGEGAYLAALEAQVAQRANPSVVARGPERATT